MITLLSFILHHRLSYTKVQKQFRGTYLDIILWGHLKGQVHISNLQMSEETKLNIKTQTAQIMGTLLNTGSKNDKKRFQAFSSVGGGHFAHLLRSSGMILYDSFYCRVCKLCDLCIILINACAIPFV